MNVFPSGFVVYATCGMTTTRHIDDSVAGCLAWGALMRDDGWTVTEPVPFTGDNVATLKRGEDAA